MKNKKYKYNNWKKNRKALDFLKKYNTYYIYKEEGIINLDDEKLTKIPEEVSFLDDLKTIYCLKNNIEILPGKNTITLGKNSKSKPI